MTFCRTRFKLVLKIILFIMLIGGCTTLSPTKPNEPYQGPYPSGYDEFAKKNPLLAEELSKLPEINDGISENDSAALNTIFELYEKNQKAFDIAFRQMYKVGLPDKRKYCSPLQALYWLVIDEKYSDANEIISNYSLKKLLNAAWTMEKPTMTNDEIHFVIANIKDKNLQNEYLALINDMDDASIQRMLFIDSKRASIAFRSEATKVINKYKNAKDLRWGSFDATVRLNSPELVDYFLINFVHYGNSSGISSAKMVFKYKRADCTEAARFAKRVLKPAGYKVFGRKGRVTGIDGGPFHIGSGIITEDGKFVVVANFDLGGLSGPYDTIEEVDHAFGFMKNTGFWW